MAAARRGLECPKKVKVTRVFNSTYFNEGGFHLMRADHHHDRPHRLAFDAVYDSRYDVAARIWKPDPEAVEMLVLRAWLQGRARHLVLDAETGVLLADGFERREGESWKQARARLVAIGAIN
jgi:hypothetical protein